jgi:two-component system, CitB family, response regulator DctR
MEQLTVALVEDDPLILKLNRSFLKEIPHHFRLIWEATTIAKALEKIKVERPDLLLLDIYLPDNSGLFLLAALKEEGDPPSTIMITSADESETVIKALELGARDYLIKPYVKERFIQALENFYENQFQTGHRYTQSDVDQLFWKRKEQRELSALPKGLNSETLVEIIKILKETDSGVTVEELARDLGIAVVSIRRYLHYLITIGKIKYHPLYGQQGRPAHRYFITEQHQFKK